MPVFKILFFFAFGSIAISIFLQTDAWVYGVAILIIICAWILFLEFQDYESNKQAAGLRTIGHSTKRKRNYGCRRNENTRHPVIFWTIRFAVSVAAGLVVSALATLIGLPNSSSLVGVGIVATGTTMVLSVWS